MDKFLPRVVNYNRKVLFKIDHCLFCLDSAALLMLNDQQQFYLFCQI